jgi:hypothetical protein
MHFMVGFAGGMPASVRSARARHLARLQGERRKLSARLAKLNREIEGLSAKTKIAPSVEDLDHWIDEISEGLDDLSPLPADFARDDLYADHD